MARKPGNLPAFAKGLASAPPCNRYWSVIGLQLLDMDAAPAAAALKSVLADCAYVVKLTTAWTLIRIGQRDECLAALCELLFKGGTPPCKVHNVLDWGDNDAVPLTRDYLKTDTVNPDDILGKIAQNHGIPFR